MQRLSFFKLPAILVLFFCIFHNAFSIYQVVIELIKQQEEYHDFLLDIESLSRLICFYLPDYFLLFGISATALYRINVHIVTIKNSVLLGINALLIIFIHYLLFFCRENLLGNLETNHFLYDVTELAFYLSISLTICYYIVISLITYLFIKLTAQQFDKSKQPFTLNNSNSLSIHFFMFITFFSFGYTLITLPFMVLLFGADYIERSLLLYDYGILILIGFNILVIMLATRAVFTQPFVTLQLNRLVKSAIIANLLVLILNITAIFTVVMILFEFDLPRYITRSEILFAAILIFYVILFCAVIRMVAKRYFSRILNNSMP